VHIVERAERLGWIPDVANWQALRQIRNQFTHEYAGSVENLVAALIEAHQGLPALLDAARAMVGEVRRRGWVEAPGT
jgi:uncharacterized protein with HEPN domain